MRTKSYKKSLANATNVIKFDLPRGSYLLGLSVIQSGSAQVYGGLEVSPIGVVPTVLDEVLFPVWADSMLDTLKNSTILSSNGVPVNDDHEVFVILVANAATNAYITVYYQ